MRVTNLIRPESSLCEMEGCQFSIFLTRALPFSTFFQSLKKGQFLYAPFFCPFFEEKVFVMPFFFGGHILVNFIQNILHVEKSDVDFLF